jgi:cytochrome b6-f complex iron-sulfur subunit
LKSTATNNNTKPEDTTLSVSRRRFISWGIIGIAGIIAGTFIYPLVELAGRRTAGKRLVFYDAVPLDDMPETGMKKVELAIRGGTMPDTRLFLRRDPGGALTAFSALCTHLGCLVNYSNIKKEFICPCHAGRYDSDGRVIEGPPPAPLTRLPVRIAGDKIQVGLKV